VFGNATSHHAHDGGASSRGFPLSNVTCRIIWLRPYYITGIVFATESLLW
jgi:hypothetical protein